MSFRVRCAPGKEKRLISNYIDIDVITFYIFLERENESNLATIHVDTTQKNNRCNFI